MAQSNILDEKTKIKLFHVLVAVPIFATWLWYMASLFHDVAEGKSRDLEHDIMIQRNSSLIEQNREKTMIYLIEIDKRTIRIEEYLRHKQ